MSYISTDIIVEHNNLIPEKSIVIEISLETLCYTQELKKYIITVTKKETIETINIR